MAGVARIAGQCARTPVASCAQCRGHFFSRMACHREICSNVIVSGAMSPQISRIRNHAWHQISMRTDRRAWTIQAHAIRIRRAKGCKFAARCGQMMFDCTQTASATFTGRRRLPTTVHAAKRLSVSSRVSPGGRAFVFGVPRALLKLKHRPRASRISLSSVSTMNASALLARHVLQCVDRCCRTARRARNLLPPRRIGDGDIARGGNLRICLALAANV